MTSARPHTLGHFPALDGLRGLALLGVLLFHANGALPGGYLGVDLFFVLSGFLITSLLLAEHREAGRVSLAAFWVRRARRLFPALLSLMPAVAAYAWFLAKPEELAGIRADALATLGYVANWHTVLSQRSYWELFRAPSPLEHMWSLSIEEQFYVAWPLLVTLLLPRGRKVLGGAIAILVVASMAAMWVLFDPARTSRAYLGTDTRMAGILAGAALAMILRPGWRASGRALATLDVLGATSAAALGLAWYALEGSATFLYHGGLWLTELAALVLIACAVAGRDGRVARALSARPLVLLGTVSYGAYLWHWPVNVVLTAERAHLHGLSLHALRFALTFAIAAASYRLLERPIRTRGVPFGRPVFIVPTAVALAVLLVVRATHARPVPPAPRVDLPPPGGHPTRPAAAAPEWRLMVVGDSTANSLGWTIRGLRKVGVAVDLEGKDSCTMLWDTCGAETWAARTRELRPDATLVFFGGAFLHGLGIDGDWRKSCHPGWDRKFEETVTARLGDLTGERARVFIATLPYPLGPYESAAFRKEVDCINASIRRSAARVPRVNVLELGERLCPKGECEREYEGAIIRVDGVHYSMDGGKGVAEWVLGSVRP